MHRTAYEQETRKIILSMDRVKKVSPQGKPILDGVGLGGSWYLQQIDAVVISKKRHFHDTMLLLAAGMYLGAKIAILVRPGRDHVDMPVVA